MTTPSLLLTGGPVFDHPPGTAVLTSGSQIVAVGAERDLEALATKDTERIELDDRMLIAGFQDAHVHPVIGGLQRLRCNLESATDAAMALRIISTCAGAVPEGGWLRGGGWHYSWFSGGNPPAELLDRITDRLVWLVVADGHSGWANRAALRLAGIDAATPDPDDGIIVRLPDGTPQGTLHEGAMKLIERVLPDDSAEELDAALLAAQDYLLSLGITAWQDASVTPEIDAAYRRLADSGRLRCRVRGALWWERDRGMEQLDSMVDSARNPVAGYVPATVKLMLDGVCENGTAALLFPYRNADGTTTGNHGLDFIDPTALGAIASAIDRAGLQCHFHAIGDRATRNALDAIQAAREVNGSSRHRHHVAHLQIVDPADVPRFAQLDVTANIQPLWACAEESMTELTIPFLPPGRLALQYPFAALKAAGARLAMGSDWSVSTPDVMQQIGVAATRTRPNLGITEPFLPEQRLATADALRAATAGSAHVNFFDDSGSIEQGRRADLVVLSGDPRIHSPFDITVSVTILAGEIVFQG